MSAILILKKESLKKHKVFIFIKDCYFAIGGPFNLNVSVFRETSVAFPKSVILQLFPKYSQSYINLYVKSKQIFNDA